MFCFPRDLGRCSEPCHPLTPGTMSSAPGALCRHPVCCALPFPLPPSQSILAPQTCPIWDGPRHGDGWDAGLTLILLLPWNPASPAPNPDPEMIPPVCSGPCWSLTDPVHQGELSSGVSILSQGSQRVAEQLGGPSELQPWGSSQPCLLLCIHLLHT